MNKKRQIISIVSTILAFVFLIIFFFLLFYKKDDSSLNTQFPVKIDLTNEKDKDVFEEQDENEIFASQAEAKVVIPANMTVLQIHDLNLDYDQEEEQIIIAKSEHTINPVIRIYVVDYDAIRETYRISWSDNTQATNVTSFKVFVNDVTGDRDLEIVCTGINKDKGQTIDIYKRVKSERAWELSYKNIASFSTQGTLNLLEKDRGVAYTNNQALGDSFDIEAMHQESENSTFLTKEIYRWSATLEKYAIFETSKIDIEEVHNENLRKIHRGNVNVFLEFLTGSWIKEGRSEFTDQMYFYYDHETEMVDFYTGDIIDTFYIKRKEKRLYNQINLDTYNNFIDYIIMLMRIQVLNLNRIYINANDYNHTSYTSSQNQDKTGYYRRLSDSEINKFRNFKDKADGIEITGYFAADDGSEFYFKNTTFTQSKNGRNYSGGFAKYKIDEQEVFQLRYIEKNKTTNIDTYLIHYIDNNPNEKGFTLRPGVITINGLEEVEGTIIKLEAEIKSN